MSYLSKRKECSEFSLVVADFTGVLCVTFLVSTAQQGQEHFLLFLTLYLNDMDNPQWFLLNFSQLTVPDAVKSCNICIMVGWDLAAWNGSSVFKLWPLSLIKIFLDKVLPARIIICNIHFRAFTPSAINFILTMFLKYLFVKVSCLQKKATCCLFAKENVRFTAEMDVYVQGHFFSLFYLFITWFR